ncbi:hypothetical protein LTR48_001607 [Friedmanniomyces endolithicus]|uniref:Rhodopsin domain-containing protein n=1 Tax=Rachicladosporium monterosium TaxID=1507873 RepID=A0ABR0LD34_9PEZI|nr:hypothetical protein LTR29_000150 [Friedmanniomyces endolithicus]KAK1093810.1 hypothetical protein LTR48_001607 [Friedmanniomyces endolithicus]KAK5147041.1 hypothetical protein LTR32_001467 [Rachicladosporium monterosium]
MVALVIESWIWYGFVLAVAASRFASRRMTLGSLTRFQPDDYLMLLALLFYTTLIPTINIVSYTSSNLLPPNYDTTPLSAQDIRERTYGSKLILVVEQCQCCTIWLAKACLLTLYSRLTTLRRENLAIKLLSAYVALGFVVMEVLYFGVWCRPFSDYYAVPTPNVQCDAATDHLITNAVLNLSSDCAMIGIGLPMFVRLNLPWRKKIPLIGIFSLGIFVILAAILNKVYSFSQPFGSLWTYWYVRESSTALLVANLPFVWTFWRRVATGQGSIEGVSRRASASPEDAMRRGEKDMSGSETTNRRSSFPWHMYGGEAAHDNRRAPGGMTLDEILRESNTDLPAGETISPYTHPSLFFSRQARAATYGTDAQWQPALVNDGVERDLIRRDSSGSSRHQPNETPVSSVFPHSPNSQLSAGSFL